MQVCLCHTFQPLSIQPGETNCTECGAKITEDREAIRCATCSKNSRYCIYCYNSVHFQIPSVLDQLADLIYIAERAKNTEDAQIYKTLFNEVDEEKLWSFNGIKARYKELKQN